MFEQRSSKNAKIKTEKSIKRKGEIDMTLKELLGEVYKEGMSITEIESALAVKKLVDLDSTPMIPKNQFDSVSSEVANYKRKIKELEGTTQTAEQRLEQQMQEANELKSTYQKELSKLKATEILVKAGLDEKERESILPYVVSEDVEASVKAAQGVTAVLTNRVTATEQRVKADLLKQTPTPGAGGTPGVDYTKQIDDARERGDGAEVAALIRLQQQTTKPI